MNMSIKLNIKTTFGVKVLVDALLKNKEQHIKEYAEAKIEYDKKRKELLSELQDATYEKDEEGITEAYYAYTGLTKPVDATKMYDDYIAILQATDAPNIELTTQDANAIINDQWDWAISAKATNSTYLTMR